MTKGTSKWTAAVVLSLGVVACGDRSGTADERIDRAGDRVEEAGRETGAAINDAVRATGDAVGTAGRAAAAAIETVDVKSALIADDRVHADDINVDTDHDSKTVILKGTVQTAVQREIAEQVATREAVGYRVDNQLRLGR